MNKRKRKPRMTVAQIEALTDEIKDEIDRLHDVKNRARRDDAAKGLLDYIMLHFEVQP